MQAERPDPSVIMQLATGYWPSATLLAANEIGLFAALGATSASALEVARRTSTDLRAVTLLLDACVGLGLLRKETLADGAIYSNRPEALAYLVPESPGYLGSALQWASDQYFAWGRLAQSARSGKPAVPPEQHLGQDPEKTRHFVLGMHARAVGIARGLVPFLDLSDAQTLLDVGGGPATYAVLLAQKYPDLSITVLDLPAVVSIARELVQQAGLSERISTWSGDASKETFPVSAFDAVLFSGVLHQMSPAEIERLLAQSWQALRPGGRVLISDMMLSADRTQPPFSALFSLQMLLSSAQGAVFSSEECQTWLKNAGFTSVTIQRLPQPLPYTVVTAVRD